MFKLVSQSSNLFLLRFRTAGSGSLLGLFVSSTGKLGYRNDVTGVSTTSSTAVSSGVWHGAQVHVHINGASSTTETWLDGVKVAGLSKTESLGTTPVGQIQAG